MTSLRETKIQPGTLGFLGILVGDIITGIDPANDDWLQMCDDKDEMLNLARGLKLMVKGPYAGKEEEFFHEILDIVNDPPNGETDPIEAIWNFVFSFNLPDIDAA